MGTKISALTTTGSAPTDSYVPIAYDGQNYKISTETLRANLVGKYTADWAQSYGVVDVANGATLTVTHDLGTADVLAMVYVNSSASDTNAQEVGMMVHNSAGQFDCGCLVTSLATNSIVVQLGEDGYNDITAGGGLSTTNFRPAGTSKYIKVVVIG